MNQISPEDARWLALLVDTEGCIVIKRVNRPNRNVAWFGAQLSIGNSCRELLRRAKEIVGLGSILTRPPPKKTTHRQMYYWQLTSKQAAAVLEVIYPYLIVKKRQARIAIFFQTTCYNRGGAKGEFGKGTRRLTLEEIALKDSLWKRCKECNQGKNPDLFDVPLPSEIKKRKQNDRKPGGYAEYKKLQDEFGADNLMSGGEIFRTFEISHRQSYRWVKRWKRENGLL